MPRLLIHKLADTYLVSDITSTGSKAEFVPVKQFTSADALREHLTSWGAPERLLRSVMTTLNESGNAIVNI